MTHANRDGGLTDLAARAGGLAWVSEQLFALEGRWADSMTDPAAVAHLATHSRHHGWHVTLWRDALPDSPALGASALIVAPDPGWMAAAAKADQLGTSDVARLAVLYRGLVPRALSLMNALADRATGPGDAHLARVVRLAQPDLTADAQRGHRLLETTLCGREAAETAASVTKVLDQAFADCY